ncbi:hypothetical protein GCM10010411_87740 [Actinomadura fulvescens]|uniref:Uncharacterized protein n=1 Tax=Actinomadura fulvescens TaxID=46160 RepID=A0ABP6DA71_9ACTN
MAATFRDAEGTPEMDALVFNGRDGTSVSARRYRESALHELAERTERAVESPLVDDYRAGRTLTFGEVAIGRSGITVDGGVLPWRTVRVSSPSPGALTLQTADTWWPKTITRTCRTPRSRLNDQLRAANPLGGRAARLRPRAHRVPGSAPTTVTRRLPILSPPLEQVGGDPTRSVRRRWAPRKVLSDS